MAKSAEPLAAGGVVARMAKDLPVPPIDRQRSEVLVEIGKAVRLRVSVDLSPAGLLAIGALVSGILLSTAVLVGAAGTAAARQPRRGDR